MNVRMLLPRHRHPGSGWLARQWRALRDLSRLIANYRHYRRQHYRPIVAWRLARNTL